jgi:hypothetical protein
VKPSKTITLKKNSVAKSFMKQNDLFHNVLAHLDEQVKSQMDKVHPSDHKKVLIIYTGKTPCIFTFKGE